MKLVHGTMLLKNLTWCMACVRTEGFRPGLGLGHWLGASAAGYC